MGFEEAMEKIKKNLMYESNYLPEFFVLWDNVTREQLKEQLFGVRSWRTASWGQVLTACCSNHSFGSSVLGSGLEI